MHLIGDNHAWADQVRRFLEALEARGLSVNTISAYAYDIVILSRWLDARERKLEDIQE
jgi:site-specific recombinase XerD